MNKRKIVDSIRLAGAVLFSWVYVPHIVLFMFDRGGGNFIGCEENKEPV